MDREILLRQLVQAEQGVAGGTRGSSPLIESGELEGGPGQACDERDSRDR
jgi:hypothetical protein